MSFKYIKVKTKGQNEGEKLLVPKLRFKEFHNKWIKLKLKDISNDISYGMNSAATDFDGINKYIRITDINEDTSLYNNSNPVSPSGYLDDKFLLQENDILFARTGASTGKTYLYNKDDGKLYFAGFLIRASIKKDYNSRFVFEQTKLNKYNNWVKIMSMRSGQPGINSTEYGNYEISITNSEEQEKIAKFVSLLDKKIELQQRRIEALKIYKKGLSKKLFDKKSNLFFNDCFFHFGGTALEEYVTENAKYRFISIGNYSSDGTYIDNGQRINNTGKAKDKILNKNDLVMVLNDKTSQGNIIGSTILIDEDNKYIYNQRSERIKCNSNIIPKYAWCILNSTNIRNIILKKSQGGTQIYINFHEIEKLKLYVPSIEEQIKLSNIYYSIVSKLNIEDQKLNNLNTFKKSLLQQMFI